MEKSWLFSKLEKQLNKSSFQKNAVCNTYMSHANFLILDLFQNLNVHQDHYMLLAYLIYFKTRV